MMLLRDVLTAFEQAEGPLRVSDLAEQLNASSGTVAGMIDFWVRKGRLRVVDCRVDCGTCPADECLLKTLRLPPRYELVRDVRQLPTYSARSQASSPGQTSTGSGSAQPSNSA